MKKSLFLTAALCGSMAANAELSNTDFANNDYIAEWGRLKLVGNQLSSQDGKAIQLKGWSTFSINYDEVKNCLTQDGFKAMKAWGANIVRLACYPENSKGKYAEYQDNDIQKYIKWASDQKMYVLLDWHVLEGDGGSGNPTKYTNDAKGFFQRNATWCKQNGFINVLYEICNEPMGQSWDQLKNYSNEILPVIEKADPGAMVVIPTPQWDQNPHEAANSEINRNQYNLGLLYSTHVYTCSHMGDVVPRMVGAAASIPIFVSEWGAVRFDGDGNLCTTEAGQFLARLLPSGNNGGQLISWCYWAWGEKNEQSNCIKNCSQPYNSSNLRPSGEYIVPVMNGGTEIEEIKPSEEWAIQEIPLLGKDYGTLNVGWFDKGGEGIAYHDANSSMYVDPETKADVKTGEAAKGTEAEICNMGVIYSNIKDYETCFRYNECVDVSNQTAGLGANWGAPGDGYGTTGADLHNLCMTEPGEWVIYTIDVKKKGYYTVRCMTNSTTSSEGTIGFQIAKGTNPGQNGNIIRSWAEHNDPEAEAWGSFQLTATPKCGMYPDGTQDPSGAEKGKKDEDWTCWGWVDAGADLSDDLTVLFKYEGVQKLQMTISPDAAKQPGDLSNFMFTFKSADIPDFEYEDNSQDGVNAESADLSSVAVYPNPAENEFTVTTGGAANVSIYSAAGVMVYNQNVEGNVVVNNNFPAGIYTVRVANAKGVKSIKLVVK